MKKASTLYLGIGFILVAITLIIFFVPRMGELDAVTTLEWTKLGIVLASQVILIMSMVISSCKSSMFSVLSVTSLSTTWFIINLIVTFVSGTMEGLIVWTSVIFLIYLAMLLFTSFAGNTIKEDEAREKKLMEESKKKNKLAK